MRRMLSLLSLSTISLAGGAAIAQVAPPPGPVGFTWCSACHSKDPTVCAGKWCPPSAQACSKTEGQYDDGQYWVMVHCGAGGNPV